MGVKWNLELVQSEAHKYTKRNDFFLNANKAYSWAWRRKLLDIVCSHMTPQYAPFFERFWEKVDKNGPNGCWIWKGCKVSFGYGRLGKGNKNYLTHRVSWEMTNGPIPKQLCVLHKCDNPPCVNPEHLFLGTQTDNMADRDKKDRKRTLKNEEHPNCKLSSELIKTIRKRYSKDNVSGRALAKEYEVDFGHVYRILKNKSRRYT